VTTSKSKVHGDLKSESEKLPLATQSSDVDKTAIILDTSESSASQKSQVGFQPTEAYKALGESKATTNARLVVTFAAELGELVSWHKLETPNGVVFALYFPTDKWTTNELGELVEK
jgi:hypothetical protein